MNMIKLKKQTNKLHVEHDNEIYPFIHERTLHSKSDTHDKKSMIIWWRLHNIVFDKLATQNLSMI